MTDTLSGKRALVTAGASGIGLAIARRLRAAGAQCMVCDIDADALAAKAAASGTEPGVLADVANEAQVAHLFDQVGRQMGGLDILVNNAGISGPTAPIEQLTLEDWRQTLAVNLDGHFLCTRAAVPMLRAAGGGSIVNMSSIGGRLGYPQRAPYSAAKWGIVGLTRTLALELGADDIRVNVIQPGLVEGPRVERVMREKAAARGMDYESFRRRALRSIPLHRGVTAEDVASVVVFLVGPGAVNITGQAIPVDAGADSLR